MQKVKEPKKGELRQTEFGLLPDQWRVAKIGDICDIYDKQRIPLNERERLPIKGNFPYYGANGIVDWINNYIFDGEYVLLAEDGGYWGPGEPSAYIVSGKFWVNNHAHVLKSKEGISTNYYIQTALNSVNLLPLIGGDSRGKLTQAITKQILIPLPPLAEQKTLAFVLSTIQEAKEKTEQVINALKELKKSLMKHLFTYGPVSLEEAEKVKLKETEIGRIPEEWDVVKLGDSCDLKSGGTPSKDQKEFWEKGNIPWIKSGQCGDSVVTKAEEFITEAGLRNSSAKMLKPNSVLVAMVGATVGKTGFLMFEACTNQNVAGIYPKESSCTDPKYLFYTLQNRYSEFTKIKGFVIANLSFIKNVEVPRPHIEVQKTIASVLTSVDVRIEEENAKSAALNQLFKSMLHNLMTAKVRVNDLNLGEENG
jgi:type I restriction enzyme S subunit